MSVPSAMQKLEEGMADGSIFTDPGDILMMAQDLGFVVVNAEMDAGDGFILVDEENGIPEYGSHKVIGVNVKNEEKTKKEFIAQELALYLMQKRTQEGKPLKLAQKDTLKLRSEVVREIQNNKNLSFFKVKKDQPLTEDEKETVYGRLAAS